MHRDGFGGMVAVSTRHFATWVWFGRNFYSDAPLLYVILFAMPSATHLSYGACFSASVLCFDLSVSFVSHLLKMHFSILTHISIFRTFREMQSMLCKANRECVKHPAEPSSNIQAFNIVCCSLLHVFAAWDAISYHLHCQP